MDKLQIDNIYIIPKNDKYCCYRINGKTEMHLMKLEEMKLLIGSLLHGEYNQEVHDLLYSFQYFIIDILNKELIPLSISEEDKLKGLKKEQKETMELTTALSIYAQQQTDKRKKMWQNTNIYKKFSTKKK